MSRGRELLPWLGRRFFICGNWRGSGWIFLSHMSSKSYVEKPGIICHAVKVSSEWAGIPVASRAAKWRLRVLWSWVHINPAKTGMKQLVHSIICYMIQLVDLFEKNEHRGLADLGENRIWTPNSPMICCSGKINNITFTLSFSPRWDKKKLLLFKSLYSCNTRAVHCFSAQRGMVHVVLPPNLLLKELDLVSQMFNSVNQWMRMYS